MERLDTYGPISEGVTGSEGGGGRFIKVGAAILANALQPQWVSKCCRRLSRVQWLYFGLSQGCSARASNNFSVNILNYTGLPGEEHNLKSKMRFIKSFEWIVFTGMAVLLGRRCHVSGFPPRSLQLSTVLVHR